MEHLGDAAKAIGGVGTEAAKARLESGRAALLAGGKAGLERWLGEAFAEVPEGVDPEPLVGLAARANPSKWLKFQRGGPSGTPSPSGS